MAIPIRGKKNFWKITLLSKTRIKLSPLLHYLSNSFMKRLLTLLTPVHSLL